jgi:hypothetical protein
MIGSGIQSDIVFGSRREVDNPDYCSSISRGEEKKVQIRGSKVVKGQGRRSDRQLRGGDLVAANLRHPGRAACTRKARSSMTRVRTEQTPLPNSL